MLCDILFIQRAAKLALYCICYCKSIRSSVCLSVRKTRECRGMRSSPSARPVSLVFWCQEWLILPVQVKFERKMVDPVKTAELYIFCLRTPEPQ